MLGRMEGRESLVGHQSWGRWVLLVDLGLVKGGSYVQETSWWKKCLRVRPNSR